MVANSLSPISAAQLRSMLGVCDVWNACLFKFKIAGSDKNQKTL